MDNWNFDYIFLSSRTRLTLPRRDNVQLLLVCGNKLNNRMERFEPSRRLDNNFTKCCSKHVTMIPNSFYDVVLCRKGRLERKKRFPSSFRLPLAQSGPCPPPFSLFFSDISHHSILKKSILARIIERKVRILRSKETLSKN